MENNMNINMETVFDKSVKYDPTFDEANYLVEKGKELLSEYFDCLHDDEGLWKMFSQDGKFWEAKGWFISAMQRHPAYNGRYQVVIKGAEFHRYINSNAVNNFREYIREYTQIHSKYTNGKGEYKSDEEYRDYSTRIYFKQNVLRQRYRITRFMAYKNAIAFLTRKEREWVIDPTFEFVERSLWVIADHVTSNGTHLIDEDVCKHIEKLASEYKIKFRGMQSGQKATRLIQKLCKLIDLDKDVQIVEESFIRQDGQLVTRTKDKGWNYQYALLCDSLNPITVKGTAVISVNPLDFWTMSFGKGWASCHTIDKMNRRRNDCNYSGCYCGGTESNMLDDSSVLFYFLPEDWDGERPELEDKVKRCVFYLGEDKVIQSRVYPDGRDGGDMSLAGDIRAIMQKVIAELFDVPNYWKVEKGTNACCEVIRSVGPHYRDYKHYEDCNVSYMKRVDGYLNKEMITVGSPIICPACGETHYTEDNIFCEECQDYNRVYCYRCDCAINRNEAIEINGDYYCTDCVDTCDDCGDYTSSSDTRITYNGRCVCDSCLDYGYTYSRYYHDYVPNEEVIVTEEGRTCMEGGEGYFECPRCGEYHNIEEANEYRNDAYCHGCYEQLTADETEDEE